MYGSHYSSSSARPEHMHCTYCGQELAPDATRCYRCGHEHPFQLLPYYYAVSYPFDAGGYSSANEICEIGWIRKAVGLTARIFFQAEANGPNGKYIVATSEPAPDEFMDYVLEGALPRGRTYRIPRNTEAAIAVYTELIGLLIEDGWIYGDRGMFWWNQRFRRPIEPTGERPEQPGNDTRRIDRDLKGAG